MKTCKKCGLSKPECDFYDRRGRRGKIYKRGACKACCRDHQHFWLLLQVVAAPHALRSGALWTMDDDDYLICNYGRGKSGVQCARTLSRSYRGVMRRVTFLGIGGRGDWRLESGIDLGAVA